MRAWYGVIALIVGALTGCSTGAQIELSRMKSVAEETNAATKTCLEKVVSKADYAPLQGKLNLSTDAINVPLELTTNQDRPSKKDIGLLYKLYADFQACRKIAVDGATKVHPLFMLTLVETYSEGDKLWTQMVGGNMTWGQFNLGRKEIAAQYRARMVRAGEQIDAQLQKRHAFEIEQRQRAAQSFQQWAYQRGQPPPVDQLPLRRQYGAMHFVLSGDRRG
jgi:hypothetical protein